MLTYAMLTCAAMNVAHSDTDLESYLGHAVEVLTLLVLLVQKYKY